MTEDDLSTIETELKLRLPDGYRRIFFNRRNDLKRVDWFEGDGSFYLDADHLIKINRDEEPPDSATSYAFPGWAETFFMIGTNGGGDYYCLRRDGKPGVWMIGSDCGDKPTLIAKTIQRYVEDLLRDWQKELHERAEVENRRQLRAAEIDANFAAIERDGGSQRARDWMYQVAMYPFMKMLDELWHKPSPRKMRLFGLACCARIPRLRRDRVLRNAIDLARRMTTSGASDYEIDQTRGLLSDKVENLQGNYEKYKPEEYRRRLWTAKAVHHLFQPDDKYLRDADIYPGDPVLKDAYDAVSYVLHDGPYGNDVDVHLLREVLGNPFHPVEFSPDWRTAEVRSLARKIHEKEAFHLMPKLAVALESAGCTDLRVLTHCRQQCEHVRGCWVIDELLGLEPKPSDEDFSWGYKFEHPTIAEDVLKERLRMFGTGSDEGSTIDDVDALDFAEWLDEMGDPHWAAYIRARCRIDDREPGEDYPDALEQWIEAGDRMTIMREQFEGFYHSGYRFKEPTWQKQDSDPWIRGLPTIVNAVPPSDGPRPIELVARQWNSLVQCTPIRGIDIQRYYSDEFDKFLISTVTGDLKWLAFDSRPEDGQQGPLDALFRSSHSASIERLEMKGILTDAEVDALALAHFPSLRHLRLPSVRDVREPLDRLMQADWFRQLETLELELWYNQYPDALRGLAGMAHLHSLALFRPKAVHLEALCDPCELPSLRRLAIDGGDSRLPLERFRRIRAPLIELGIEQCRADRETLASLMTSPLCAGLRILHFAGPRINEDEFEILATSPFASGLRALRLHCGDQDLNGRMSSLADTPLTRGAFPNLTMLDLRNPFSESATRDTAAFLSKLQTPCLRHLNLVDCATNDECTRIVETSAKFANLRRVSFRD